MKTGYEIYIQKDLSDIDKERAKKFCQSFIDKTNADPKKRYWGETGGGYTSGMWRGRLGISLYLPGEKEYDANLVSRRISKNKRTFAVVHVDTMEVHNDKYLDKAHYVYRDIVPDGPVPKNHCYCSRHKGSIKVRFKGGKPPELEFFYRTGEVKG